MRPVSGCILGGMGRLRRPYLPGAIFHVTARTIRRERWFTPPLRTIALEAIAATVPRSGSRLLAVAIMPNHLHLVVQQGEKHLKRLMQPLLRRLAGAVQKAHDLEGPVFWRPSGYTPCLHPAHARHAIAYTHLNPFKGRLCDDFARYPWTSHVLYDGASGARIPSELEPIRRVLDPTLALPLFATGPARSMHELRADYREFLAWRRDSVDDDAEDTAEAGDPTSTVIHDTPPPSRWEYMAGESSLGPLFHAPARWDLSTPDGQPAFSLPDIHSAARDFLAREAPHVSLRMIRGRGGGLELSRIRHRLIRWLHEAGFTNVRIARFLEISESAVWYALNKADRPGAGW